MKTAKYLSENKRDFICLQLIDYQVVVQFTIYHSSLLISLPKKIANFQISLHDNELPTMPTKP